jgi:hypothetical protein
MVFDLENMKKPSKVGYFNKIAKISSTKGQ